MTTITPRTLVPLLGGWRDSGGVAFRVLADRIRLLAVDGRIVAGSRLPAERELATALGVSRTTVTSAYSSLRESGHLSSLRGSGSVVRLPEQIAARGTRTASSLDFTRAVMPAAPQVLDAATRAAAELPELVGWDYDLIGMPRLRELIADRYTARGLPTRADEILVTGGAQAAIGLLARTLITPGDRVLVESPSYPHALDAVRSAGGRPVTVPVSATTRTTPGGWDDQALGDAFAQARPTFGYLMPSFHNPTAAVMPDAQRDTVTELARRYGTRLVVDETIAELAIDGPAPGPFPSDVIHVGSVAKTLWGGLRIGWIRTDPRTIRQLAQHRAPWELGTPILDQLVVTQALPDLDAVLADRQEQLRAGRDILLGLLADDLPEWELPVVTGGFCAWIGLGAEVSSALTIGTRRRGLALTAGPRFGVDGAFERFLRIPFGYDTRSLRTAVSILTQAWAEARDTGPVPLDPAGVV